MAQPKCEFCFEVFADCFSDDDMDDHLYHLYVCPPETIDNLVAILREIGEPKHPVWVPVVGDKGIEDKIKELESQMQKTSLIIQSRDMIDFTACWLLA